MPQFNSVSDSLFEQTCLDREFELLREQECRRRIIIHVDSYWEPRIVDTVTEMFWHRARLDAVETAGRLLIEGSEVDAREIVLQTVPESLSLLPNTRYLGIDGESVLISMIVEWNERMIEEMISKERGEN